MSDTTRQAGETLRGFALQLPGAFEDNPWGDHVVKVGKKIFVFLGLPESNEARLYVGVKLPQTGPYALQMPFVSPMAYGLGKHGWVSVDIPTDTDPPVDLLLEWIEESYRALAPKRLIAQLDQARPSLAPS